MKLVTLLEEQQIEIASLRSEVTEAKQALEREKKERKKDTEARRAELLPLDLMRDFKLDEGKDSSQIDSRAIHVGDKGLLGGPLGYQAPGSQEPANLAFGYQSVPSKSSLPHTPFGLQNQVPI